MRAPTENSGMLRYLEIFAPILPINCYWTDIQSIVLGGNKSVFKALGAKSKSDVIGKSPYALYPRALADKIVQQNNGVMCAERVSSHEEIITHLTSRHIRYFTAIKAPLRNDDGQVIGIVATSVDMTEEKEEALLMEERNRRIAEEREKYFVLAQQAANDIRPPILALTRLIQSCDELSEHKRVLFQGVSESILKIAENLVCGSGPERGSTKQ